MLVNNKNNIRFLVAFIASSNAVCMAADAASVTTTTTTSAPATHASEIITKSSAAAMDESQVIKWAEAVALEAFTYNYQNYQKHLEKLSESFTAQGWQSYTKALKESNNLDSVIKQQINVTAKVTDRSKLLEQRGNQDMHAWKVQIPVQVTYKNPRGEMQQNLLVELTISTGFKVANSTGLGVMQFVAKPS